MNSMQMDALVSLAKRGADHARVGNDLLVQDYTATLRGWFQCANFAHDRETSRAAQRAETWVECAYDYHQGKPHTITDLAASLMWGES
ncbi:hypothetical protein ACRYJU_07280 [Alloalcanivorax xenomutans]|uniref:hypothetical protein n=1 Tax=Alloalcanivorax xenomutans TaxID=1094342 RepID=UPI003D9BE639